MLRQIEVSIANGKNTPQACKEAEITVQTSTAGARNTAAEDGPGEAAERTGKRERQVEAVGGGAVVGQADPEGYCGGKLLRPERRRCTVEHDTRRHDTWNMHLESRVLG